MTVDEMKQESKDIIMGFAERKATQGEAMVILAKTLAIVFRVNGVNQHEAINRFATIAKDVYKEMP